MTLTRQQYMTAFSRCITFQLLNQEPPEWAKTFWKLVTHRRTEEWKMIEEELYKAVDDCLKRNGYEWKPDGMASECFEVPEGETPYIHGQNLIESIADLVQKK
jgi:hypothetical protein